jgi:hypothetical protein
MQRKSLVDVPINNPIPYENNPRFSDKAVPHVKESIKKYGYVKASIGVDENFVLLYGHTTLKALKELKYDTVPEITQITGLSETQKRGYRIADNKTGEYAGWDFVKLIDEMEFLQDNEEDLVDSTGFGKAVFKSEKFGELDKQVDALNELEDVKIELIVPKKDAEAVKLWLAFGESGTTGAILGRGVMKRCGLL